jgi:hypothetical protein
MELYRKRPNGKRRSLVKRTKKLLESSTRGFLLLLNPALATAFVLVLWFYVIFENDCFFLEGAREVVIAGYIPVFGIFYAILAGAIVTIVFEEYKSIRMAIKNDDLDTFINLYDEDLSPFFHVLMTLLASFIIIALMGLKYGDAASGVFVIGTTTYTLSLIYWIIIEIDSPLWGLWFIKSVDREWLMFDVVSLREERRRERRSLRIEKEVGDSPAE